MHGKTIFWLLMVLLATLAMGALQARQKWLRRGLPEALPEPVVGGGVQFGLNVSLEQYNDDELSDHLHQIYVSGAKRVKQSFYFADLYDWEASDRLVEAVVVQGLTLVPLLDGSPDDDFAALNPVVFAQWAGEFASRYRNAIQHYIIWDEPNLTSHWGHQPVNANEYAALLTAAAAAIRVADGDALIVAAPLAPTDESGPMNLSEVIYLRAMYEAGADAAFDIAAAKPYGFNFPPDDRDVSTNKLNFSRIILLREEMERNGDSDKAIWAGNWGWNSLPDGWAGEPSIWGEVTHQQQREWTAAALTRAQKEWPWMGLMFLENWQPDAPATDARWGFAIAGTEIPVFLRNYLDENFWIYVAQPGFHFAQARSAGQFYTGGWRFSPEFGADISQPSEGTPNDQVAFTFWGTDVGLRVRRADFRARLYVTVDGRPANALPRDENGTMLLLTSPDPAEDYITTEVIAHNLNPGVHTVQIEAARGWDQWALNGFSVGYRPPNQGYVWMMTGLVVTIVFSLIMAVRMSRRAGWGAWVAALRLRFLRLSERGQAALTAVMAVTAALAGWFTWGEQAAGVYRRLGDGGQLLATAMAATLFYVTPTFFIYIIALLILFLLIYFRPVWGLALIAFSFPLYVATVTKTIFHLNFSAVELFTLITLAAFLLHKVTAIRDQAALSSLVPHNTADYAVLTLVAVATLSLFFTERVDVASNEWRVVIVEPAIFYLLFRAIRPNQKELWIIWDAFVLSALVVAGYGLWQYIFARETLITAEGGLLRLRSFYGSPNNVALYLGRVLPMVTAVILFGRSLPPQRRRAYSLAAIPIGLAILLTFSKGGLFLGVPTALLVIFWRWQQQRGRPTWPWVIGLVVLGITGLFVIQQIPQLAGRFNLTGETGMFRLNLWRASWQMIAEHPWLGVGLDNFLYAYRGRYIFDAAWREPNLNHPHNILLDFATRLGLLGLLAGGWLFGEYFRRLRQLWFSTTADQLPLVVGLVGMLADIIVHGLVDHSFFLVDLAFILYLGLATTVWLAE